MVNELEQLMNDIAIRCKQTPPPSDWSFRLYRLIEKGFHSFFKYKLDGMLKEDMTGLQRASVRVGGWWFESRVINKDEWVGMYQEWKEQ